MWILNKANGFEEICRGHQSKQSNHTCSASIVQQAELYKLRTVLRTLEYPLEIDNTARHQWNQERSTTSPTPNDPDKLCMSRMAATYQNQNENLNERKLEGPGEEVIAKLQILVQQIEAQSEQPQVLYGKLMKMLSAESRTVLNIVKEEFNAASSAQRRDLLCGLDDRLKGFDETLVDCRQFVETLNGRGTVLTVVLKKYDLKRMKMYHEEVRKKGEEIERRITRLKTCWPDHAAPSPRGVVQAFSTVRGQPGYSAIPPLSPTSHMSSVRAPGAIRLDSPPTTSLSQATVRDSSFYSAGNDIHRTTVNDYSRTQGVGNVYETIVNGDQYVLHFYNEGRGSGNN